MVRVAFALLLLLLPSAAWAQGRFALLIGNQAYNARVGPLKNPHNDVALIGAALKSLGFKVAEVKDADYRTIDTAINRHVQNVRREGPGSISFVYYSGHGAANPDTKINYLIPVDVANADDEDLWTNSLNLNKIVEGLREQAPEATHYVVFDACRNELNLTSKGKKALAGKGFVPIAYTPGVMVAYATAPGKTAADVGSGSGPYAKALADEMVKPGVEAMYMFRRVALRVNREIGQDPWMSASTLPEVYFAGNAAPGSPPPSLTQPSEVERAWGLAKESTSIAVLEAFIVRYKQSFYADLARARIEELKGKQGLATVAPPAAPTPQVKPGAALAAPSRSKEEINEECSKRADARKLTGQARWDFRTKCKTELVGGR
jgi:Caspase domain